VRKAVTEVPFDDLEVGAPITVYRRNQHPVEGKFHRIRKRKGKRDAPYVMVVALYEDRQHSKFTYIRTKQILRVTVP